ncbi:MAG: chemotaxis protein CheD [Rhodoferax sp.]
MNPMMHHDAQAWLSPPAESRALELLPGDVAAGSLGDSFRTLLGSCIAVLLTDPRRTVGAMCHIVHAGDAPPEQAGDTAWAQPALEDLFARLQHMGISPQLCEAYVYGGGNMFPEQFGHGHVGEDNAAWVQAFLQLHGIPVVDAQTGGAGYRKVRWTVGAHAPEVDFVTGTLEPAHAG